KLRSSIIVAGILSRAKANRHASGIRTWQQRIWRLHLSPMADFRNFLTQHFGPGFLAGITLGDWLRLLAANRFRSSPRHWARTGLLTLNAPLSSGLKVLEDAFFSGAIRRTEVAPPVFVLGSWRSGTTFLHTL